jgi:hypothetical protein
LVNAFFIKNSILTKTDKNFCTKRWKIGEYINGLNCVASTTQVGDTLVNLSLQIRKETPKIQSIKTSHHMSITDGDMAPLIHKKSDLHVGSLSSVFIDNLWETKCNFDYIYNSVCDQNIFTKKEVVKRYVWMYALLLNTNSEAFRFHSNYSKNLNCILFDKLKDISSLFNIQDFINLAKIVYGY